MDRWINGEMDEWLGAPKDGWMNGLKERYMDGRTDEKIDGCMDERMERTNERRINGWMDEWTERKMYGWEGSMWREAWMDGGVSRWVGGQMDACAGEFEVSKRAVNPPIDFSFLNLDSLYSLYFISKVTRHPRGVSDWTRHGLLAS